MPENTYWNKHLFFEGLPQKPCEDHTKDSDQSDVSMDAAEILKEAKLLQEDTASDSDVSMEDKLAKDDLDEKLDESMLEDSEDDNVKYGKKEEIVELPTSSLPDW